MTEVRMLCAGTDAILEKVQNATRLVPLVNIGIKKIKYYEPAK